MNSWRICCVAAVVALVLAPACGRYFPTSFRPVHEQVEGMTVNDDGSISTGTIYIKRPGKVRFEYNAPDSGIVVAGSNTVVIYDKKSNQPAETYPLSKTPLSIILAANVNLGQAKMVTGHNYDGTATTVRAQDPAHPEYGNIELKFTGNPVELRQWIINDGNGTKTTVVLGDLQKGGSLPNKLFDVGSPGQVNR